MQQQNLEQTTLQLLAIRYSLDVQTNGLASFRGHLLSLGKASSVQSSFKVFDTIEKCELS